MADQVTDIPVIAGSSSNGESSSSNPSTESTTETSSKSQLALCTSCKSPGKADKPHKPCPKCQTSLYCSRECQKADYKSHKKICAAAAQEYAKNADLKIGSGSRQLRDGHRGGLQKWQFDT